MNPLLNKYYGGKYDDGLKDNPLLKAYKIPERRSVQPDSAQPQTTIGEDIAYGALGAIPAAINMMASIPGEAVGVARQVVKDPFRVLQNLTTGVAELGQGISNAPSNIARYVGEKNLLDKGGMAEKVRSAIEGFRAKDVNIPETLGVGDSQSGDALLRLLPELPIWAATGGSTLPAKGAFQAAKFGGLGAIKNQNPVELALMPAVAKGGIKGASKVAGGVGSKVANTYKDIKARNALGKSIPETDAKLISLAEDMINNERNYDVISESAKALDKNQTKGRLASITKDFYDNEMAEVGSLFDNFTNSQYGQQPVIPIPKSGLKAKGVDLNNLTTDATRVLGKLSKKDVVGADYLDAYRAIRDEAYSLRRANDPRATNISKLEDAIYEGLNNVIGKEGRAILNKANNQWKARIKPFRNKVFLRNAIADDGVITSNSFIDEFGKKNVERVRNRMMQNEAIRDAMMQHDLAHNMPENIKGIGKFKRTDIFKMLPEEMSATLENIYNKSKSSHITKEDLQLSLEKQKLSKQQIADRLKWWDRAKKAAGLGVAAGYFGKKLFSSKSTGERDYDY